MKNMNVKAAMEECKAKPDPKKCIEDKKAEALKKCNWLLTLKWNPEIQLCLNETKIKFSCIHLVC